MDYIRIVGIDPGSNLGVSILTIDPDDMSIVSIETELIVISGLIGFGSSEDHSAYRYRVLYERLSSMLRYYNPHYVSIESAFMGRFPKAFGVLSSIIATIGLAVYDYDHELPFRKISPLEVKHNVSVEGMGKVDMSFALSRIDEIHALQDLDIISEHEIDAIAVAYHTLTRFRKYDILMLI